MEREKSRSKCLLFDGRIVLMFAFGQTFGSNEKQTNHQEKRKYSFFHEHAQMTSAINHISLWGCTIHSSLCLSIPCHSYFNKSPLLVDNELLKESTTIYGAPALWQAPGFVVGTQPRTRWIIFALMEYRVSCRGQILNKSFPRYLIPIVMRLMELRKFIKGI